MKLHKDVSAFYCGKHVCNPRAVFPHNKVIRRRSNGGNFGDSGKESPTQKPAPPTEYPIRTYANECGTLLYNCMGSETTGISYQHPVVDS